jgi:hypothetical protein
MEKTTSVMSTMPARDGTRDWHAWMNAITHNHPLS